MDKLIISPKIIKPAKTWAEYKRKKPLRDAYKEYRARVEAQFRDGVEFAGFNIKIG